MPEQMSDSILLERFVSRREEAAFVALVTRHGPLVRQICSRILRNEHDVEDVFQATFLVLARKAAVIPWQRSMGPWLGPWQSGWRWSPGPTPRAPAVGKSRSPALARKQIGRLAMGGVACLPDQYHRWADPAIEIERRDLNRVLDDELRQLPEKYRAPGRSLLP